MKAAAVNHAGAHTVHPSTAENEEGEETDTNYEFKSRTAPNPLESAGLTGQRRAEK